MKIYKVSVTDGNDPTVQTKIYLVRAESAVAARNHVYRVVSTRVANQDDMMLAVGDGALKIEDASEES